MRSRRGSIRKRNERGFALILALFLAILYFGFIELLMLDASRELSEARRFRARIVALTLAENGADLAAMDMFGTTNKPADETDEQGTMTGKLTITGDSFVLIGTGRSRGQEASSAKVILEGKIDGNRPIIYFSRHTQ